MFEEGAGFSTMNARSYDSSNSFIQASYETPSVSNPGVEESLEHLTALSSCSRRVQAGERMNVLWPKGCFGALY